MLNSFWLLKKEKEENTLVLDVGTEAVKALVIQEREGKTNVLGSWLEYFDNYDVFKESNFEREVFKKTILKTLERISEKINRKAEKILLGLPPNIFKARIVSHFFPRKTPKIVIDENEEKMIFQRVLAGGAKRAAYIYTQDSGILPQDIAIVNLKILEIKIDGYKVPTLQRYNGKNIGFKILATFLPKEYLNSVRNFISNEVKGIKNIIQAPGRQRKKKMVAETSFFSRFVFGSTVEVQQTKVANLRFVHIAEGLPFCLKDYPDGIFLDVGGKITQIFLTKDGKLEKADEFKGGGEIFSQTISEKLGLTAQDSRILKERYARKELSEESSQRIKEILYFPAKIWFENLKSKLKKMRNSGLFPSEIILFGGASQLSEIKEVLKKGDWQDIDFINKPKVKFVYPKDLKNIEDRTKTLKSPQDVPPLLVSLSF